MIRATIEVREGPTTRRVLVTAPTLKRALALATPKVAQRGAQQDAYARLVFPIDAEQYFAAPAATGDELQAVAG